MGRFVRMRRSTPTNRGHRIRLELEDEAAGLPDVALAAAHHTDDAPPVPAAELPGPQVRVFSSLTV